MKNSYIIENHEPANVRNYRIQRQQQHRQQQRQQRRQQRQNRPQNANYQRGIGGSRGYDDNNEEEANLESRITDSANARGQREEDEARAVTAEEGRPPDPAYQYITTHLPDCGRAALALQSVPQVPT